MGASLGTSNSAVREIEAGADLPRLEKLLARLEFYHSWSLAELEFALAEMQKSDKELSWRAFYKVACEAEKRKYERELVSKRISWHEATRGFAMSLDKDARAALEDYRNLGQVEKPEPEAFEDPAHTDDEDDDDTEEENDLMSGCEQHPTKMDSPIIEAWNPSLRSPIFFGYHDTLASVVDAAEAEREASAEKKENEVAKRQAQKRIEALDALKDALVIRKKSRDAKLLDLKKEQAKQKKLRENELKLTRQAIANDEDGGDSRRKRFEEQQVLETNALERANKAEVFRMAKKNKERDQADADELAEARAESARVDHAESGITPGGRKLEADATTALKKCQQALDDACAHLEEAETQLQLFKTEALVGDITKNNIPEDDDQYMAALRKNVHEREGQVKLALNELEHAEAMLKRALRRKAKEVQILPIFASLTTLPPGAQYNPLPDPHTEDYDETWFISVDLLEIALGLIFITGKSIPLPNKLKLLLNLFDLDSDGFLQYPRDLVPLIKIATIVLTKIGFFTRELSDDEIFSVTRRLFIEATPDQVKDALRQDNSNKLGLTLYEMQCWLSQTIAASSYLSKLFSVPFVFGELSVFQRQRMPAIRLFELGIFRSADLKYHHARDLIMDRPQLQPEEKSTVHERALTRGADDPCKSDYSRFLPKPKPLSSSVVPLDHGHLANLTVVEKDIRYRAICKIQNMYRGLRSRHEAEMAARRQAFWAAQTIASKEAKARVEEDFRDREDSEGLSRHKWDAKVRLYQAKYRATAPGTKGLDRTAAITLMRKEAIDAAIRDVHKRFEDIARERGMADNVLKKDDVDEDKENQSTAVVQQQIPEFSVLRRLCRNIMTNTTESGSSFLDALRCCVTLSDARNAAMIFGAFPQDLYKAGENNKERDLRLEYSHPMPTHQRLRSRIQVLNSSLTEVKVTDLLLELPSKQLLLKYIERMLRCDDGAIFLPTSKFLDESIAFVLPKTAYRAFPGLKLPDLEVALGPDAPTEPRALPLSLMHDLKDHFRILHGTSDLATSFQRIFCSDYEFGMLSTWVSNRLLVLDDCLLRRVTQEAQAAAETEKNIFQSKARGLLASGNLPAESQNKSIDELAKVEGQSALDKIDEILLRQDDVENEARLAIAKHEKKLRNTLQIKDQLHRRRRDMDRALKALDGNSFSSSATREDRQNWVKRYYGAIIVPSCNSTALVVSGQEGHSRIQNQSNEPKLVTSELLDYFRSARHQRLTKRARELINRLDEIVSVGEEFLSAAQRAAETIVHELHLPATEKTIKPVASRKCDGRAEVSGRGIDGYTFRYENANIRFEIATDDHGIFNGSDEFAAKAAGHYRRGAREFLKAGLHIPGLIVPLTATVDYLGFRILCVAKLPTIRRKFSGNYGTQLRSEREDMVFGTANRGATVINVNRILDRSLALCAKRLNLARHAVKGQNDLNPKDVNASVDLRGFKGDSDTQFYLLNFWRVFPPEDPEATPHLPHVPRGNSIFWRMLRPEFVKKYPEALSPDSNCVVTRGTPDGDIHRERTKTATCSLINQKLVELAEHIAQRRDILGAGGQKGLPLSMSNHENEAVPYARGFGSFDPTCEMHQNGINLRHMGLLRSRFWRRIAGMARCDFGSRFLRTTVDFRIQVRRGDQIRVCDRIFRVSKDPEHQFTATECPLDENFDGMSTNDVHVDIGEVSDDRNSSIIRLALLVEMIARAAKAIFRASLRRASQVTNFSSTSFAAVTAIDILNALTGALAKAEAVWREQLIPAVRHRFGDVAINVVELPIVRTTLEPCLPFLLRRVCALCGIRVSPRTLAAFDAAPDCFEFSEIDLAPSSSGLSDATDGASIAHTGSAYASIGSILKHGVPFLDVARALKLAARARDLRDSSYVNTVLSHNPPLYLPLDERPGSHIARNRGDLGSAMDGSYTEGVMAGMPFAASEYSRQSGARCAKFNPQKYGRIVAEYHYRCAPVEIHEPFSVECWANAAHGGDGLIRIAVMTGRFALSVLKDNSWTLTIFAGPADIIVRGTSVNSERWSYICGTYDGTMVYLYIDGVCVKSLELGLELDKIEAELNSTKKEYLDELAAAEQEERDACKDLAEKQVAALQKSKEGAKRIKDNARKLVEQSEFKAKMNVRASELNLKPLSKHEALAQARDFAVSERFENNVKKIDQKYFKLRSEFEEKLRGDEMAALERARRPATIGASCPGGRSRLGRHHWLGYLAHCAIYDICLSPDNIKEHHNIGRRGGEALACTGAQQRAAARFFGLAVDRFAIACMESPDDSRLRELHASVLVDQLSLCHEADTRIASSRGDLLAGPAARRLTASLDRAVVILASNKCIDTLADLLGKLPDGPMHAHRAVDVLDAILRIDPTYFMSTTKKRSIQFSLVELARVPARFGLRDDHDGRAQPRFRFACSQIYRLVLTELALADIYGGINLSWAVGLKSDTLLCSLVWRAEKGDNPEILDLGACFSDPFEVETLNGADLKLVSSRCRLATTLDLSGSSAISDKAVIYALQALSSLRVLVLDGCVMLTDAVLHCAAEHTPQLTLLSTCGCPQISDRGLDVIFSTCNRLRHLHLGYSGQVSDHTLALAARDCKYLEAVHLPLCANLTDDGIYSLVTRVEANLITSLDLSYCASLTDDSTSVISERCPNLLFLKLAGLHKLTSISLRQLTHRLWQLEQLVLDGTHLTTDEIFFFDDRNDGRITAKQNMLRRLTHLSLSDCARLSDSTPNALSEKAPELTNLCLSGVVRLTDTGLINLASGLSNLSVLNVGGCLELTDNSLAALAHHASTLTDLNLDSAILISDQGIEHLCAGCKRLKTLNLTRCRRLTDLAICHLVHNLFLDDLKIGSLVKLSDAAIEILALELGDVLTTLDLSNCARLTNAALDALRTHAKQLRVLTLIDCSGFSEDSVMLLSAASPCVTLLRTGDEVERHKQPAWMRLIGPNCRNVGEAGIDADSDFDRSANQKTCSLSNAHS